MYCVSIHPYQVIFYVYSNNYYIPHKKSAGGYDDMQDVRSDQRTDRGVSSELKYLSVLMCNINHIEGQAGNIRAKFENMAATNPEVCFIGRQ